MVIDVHVHPAFYDPICQDAQRINKRKAVMGYDLMSPFPLELVNKQMAFAGIDKLVLLPEDSSTMDGEAVLSNEEIDKIVRLDPTASSVLPPLTPDALTRWRCWNML